MSTEEKKLIEVVGAAIMHEGKYLVAQRSQTMSNPLKWEFPGGKVEVGESPAQALVREIEEELGIWIEVGAFLAYGTSVVGDRTIKLDVYHASYLSGEIELAEHAQVCWLELEELSGLDWAEADIPIVERLLKQAS